MTDAEMNALIAERIMNWHPSDVSSNWLDGAGKPQVSIFAWHPLTDPAQALQALETFCAQGDGYLEQIALVDGPMWLVAIMVCSGGDMRAANGEGSFCAAICEALAKAVTHD